MLTGAEWTPFQTHCYSENLVAPGIEPSTSGLAARNSEHETTEAVPKTRHSIYIFDVCFAYLISLKLAFYPPLN
jgi:hypothetical protein